MTDTDLLAVVSAFYDACIDDSLWASAVASLVTYCGGHAAAVISADPIAGKIRKVESIEVPEEFLVPYCGYYSGREIRLSPSMAFPVGLVMTEEMLLSRRDLQRSEIYNDLLVPCDFPHVMFAWLQKSPTLFQTLAIEGSKQHGSFDAAAVSRLQRVLPHVMRSMKIRSALSLSRQSERMYLDVFNTLPVGVVFLDQNSRVLWMNSEAEAFVRSGDALTQRRGHLHAARVEDDRQLQAVLGRLSDAAFRVTVAGEVFVLRRKESAGRLTVSIGPISIAERLHVPSRAAAMLLVSDPDRSAVPQSVLIAKSFGLTPAEAALAQLLFTGISLREAAAALSISINTAKTQLKCVYAKTGCSSHAGLVKAILMVSIGRSGSALPTTRLPAS